MPVITKSLYACGSNLLGHIIPRNITSITSGLDELGHELITEPHKVFANVGDARVLYAGLADVLLELTPLSPNVPSLYLRGSTPPYLDSSTPPGGELTLPPLFPHIISHGFGTPTGEFLGVVLANHRGILILERRGEGLGWTGGAEVWWEAISHVASENEQEDNAKGRIVDLSVSGNQEVAVVVEWGGHWRGVQDGAEQPKRYTLQIYPSLDSLFPTHFPSPSPSNSIPTPHPTPASTFPLPPYHIPIFLSSTLTSHALLLQPAPPSASLSNSPYNQNQPYLPYPLILTTGDPRHPSLLLHSKDSITTNSTRRQLLSLAPLEGLQDLIRLESDPGAWEVAVVDGGGGVYLFGGRAGGEGVGVKDAVAKVQAQEEEGEGEDVILISAPTLLPSASEKGDESGKVETPRAEDASGIQDVALGSSHLLALLDSGEVFAIGRAEEGQLGCGGSSEEGRGREAWVKVEFGKERKVKVEKVWAGAWGSWMLVEEEEQELEG